MPRDGPAGVLVLELLLALLAVGAAVLFWTLTRAPGEPSSRLPVFRRCKGARHIDTP